VKLGATGGRDPGAGGSPTDGPEVAAAVPAGREVGAVGRSALDVSAAPTSVLGPPVSKAIPEPAAAVSGPVRALSDEADVRMAASGSTAIAKTSTDREIRSFGMRKLHPPGCGESVGPGGGLVDGAFVLLRPQFAGSPIRGGACGQRSARFA
jgi:hypothetical protein